MSGQHGSYPTSDPYDTVAEQKGNGGVPAFCVDDREMDVAVPINTGEPRGRDGKKKVRRPKKVVYYFSSSSDDDENEDVCGDERAAANKKNHKSSGGYTSVDTSSDPCNDNRASNNNIVAAEDDEGCDRVIVIQNNNAGDGKNKAPISPSNPRIGSPTPIGFFAFGMTTLLYNVHNAQIDKKNQATMGMVIFYGGLTQFVVGWFELINMNTLGCTISTTYGAFWMATAVLYLWPANEYVDSLGTANYTGGFFFLWFVFAGTLFASSFKSPLMCILLFFTVMLNFFLQMVGFFSGSNTVAVVAGYEGIVVGALATYIGMAFTMADVYGRNILPLFPHEKFRNIKW